MSVTIEINKTAHRDLQKVNEIIFEGRGSQSTIISWAVMQLELDTDYVRNDEYPYVDEPSGISTPDSVGSESHVRIHEPLKDEMYFYGEEAAPNPFLDESEPYTENSRNPMNFSSDGNLDEDSRNPYPDYSDVDIGLDGHIEHD